MRKIKAGHITLGVFLALLVFFFSLCVLVPADTESVARENREAASFPALTRDRLFSGAFSRDFEAWLSDRVGLRSLFLNISARVEQAKGIKTDYGTLTTVDKDLGIGVSASGQLLILRDRVMEIYRRSDAAQDAYVDMLNTYAAAMPEGTRLISMVIPTQIAFHDPEGYGDSQKDAADDIYSRIDSRILTVDAYSRLEPHAEEYIYFRTDHHWTQRGAFYGYQAFCDALQLDAPPLSQYRMDSADGFLGYLYNQANDIALARYADTIEWYTRGENYPVYARSVENGITTEYTRSLIVPPANGAAPTYAMFMGGDHPFAEVTTSNKNGRTLLVIKDSYANALLPFLCEQYETVLVVDPRSYYGTVRELLAEREVDDVLIVNYMMATTFADLTAVMVRLLG